MAVNDRSLLFSSPYGLMELLANLGGGPGAAMNMNLAQDPLLREQFMIEQFKQSPLNVPQLEAPEPVSRRESIVSAIADALSAYAAGTAPRGGIQPTQFSQRLLDRQEQIRRTGQQQELLTTQAQQDRDAEVRRLQFGVTQKQGERQLEAQLRAEERARQDALLNREEAEAIRSEARKVGVYDPNLSLTEQQQAISDYYEEQHRREYEESQRRNSKIGDRELRAANGEAAGLMNSFIDGEIDFNENGDPVKGPPAIEKYKKLAASGASLSELRSQVTRDVMRYKRQALSTAAEDKAINAQAEILRANLNRIVLDAYFESSGRGASVNEVVSPGGSPLTIGQALSSGGQQLPEAIRQLFTVSGPQQAAERRAREERERRTIGSSVEFPFGG